MRLNKKAAGFASVLALTASALFSVVASAEGKTVADGVFTQAQVDAGQRVYDASCKNCHNERFYRDALRNWENQPLLYLWENTVGSMPGDNPGSLFLEEYTDVLAYILSEQGFPAGDTALDPDNGMDQISILKP